MAYFKITQNKKGELQAKIQVSGKDLSTGKSKVFTRRVYNTGGLTEAKFRKQVEKAAIAFEEEVSRAYQDGNAAPLKGADIFRTHAGMEGKRQSQPFSELL